jgi:hypothetical protein
MTERTPGPWQSRFLFRMIRRVRESPGDLLIASPSENDWGDVCLMAAAPDMEEACIALIAASHEIPPGPSDLRTALELAIRATDHLMGPLAKGRTHA